MRLTLGILSTLIIPKIDGELLIIEGSDEEELDKGSFISTAYPSEDDQFLLSGHRNTIFKRMDELEIGDTLPVQLPYGDCTYKVVETKIVGPDDMTVIGSTVPDETLTFSTCYPFNFVGSAPGRSLPVEIP